MKNLEMKNTYISFFAAVAAIGAILSVLALVPITDSYDLQIPGHHTFDPPRSDRGPGTVFEGEVRGDTVKFIRLLCRDLYAGMKPRARAATIAMPDIVRTSSVSLKAALNLLKINLGVGAAAQLELDSLSASKKLSIEWGNLTEYSYYAEDGFLATGEPRPISAPCRSAIEDMATKNIPRDRIFVITGTIAAADLKYAFADEIAASADFKAAIRGVDAGASISRINSRTLRISVPLHIAYTSPWAITEWVPTGQVAGQIVRVRGEPTEYLIDE